LCALFRFEQRLWSRWGLPTIWPDWDQLYGSAGRAAALSGQADKILLRTYARDDTAERFDFEPTAANQTEFARY
jgi:hypothetical protein